MLQTMLRPRHGKQRTARWREMCEVHGRWFLYYSGVSCGSWTYPALSTGIIDLKFITNRFIFVLQAFYFPADSKIVFAKQQWKFELLSGFLVMQDAVHAKYSFNLALLCVYLHRKEIGCGSLSKELIRAAFTLFHTHSSPEWRITYAQGEERRT